jgi:hypothetical protein
MIDSVPVELNLFAVQEMDPPPPIHFQDSIILSSIIHHTTHKPNTRTSQNNDDTLPFLPFHCERNNQRTATMNSLSTL